MQLFRDFIAASFSFTLDFNCSISLFKNVKLLSIVPTTFSKSSVLALRAATFLLIQLTEDSRLLNRYRTPSTMLSKLVNFCKTSCSFEPKSSAMFSAMLTSSSASNEGSQNLFSFGVRAPLSELLLLPLDFRFKILKNSTLQEIATPKIASKAGAISQVSSLGHADPDPPQQRKCCKQKTHVDRLSGITMDARRVRQPVEILQTSNRAVF